MEAKGVALLQRLSGNGGLKEAALLRQGNENDNNISPEKAMVSLVSARLSFSGNQKNFLQ